MVLWYGTAYAIVMWSIAAATGEWVYPMMNWGIAWSLIAYVLLPLLPFIAFLIWCALHTCHLLVQTVLKTRARC